MKFFMLLNLFSFLAIAQQYNDLSMPQAPAQAGGGTQPVTQSPQTGGQSPPPSTDGAKNSAQPASVISITATPRFVRENPVPQVFFQEISESYYMSEQVDYNHIYNAMVDGLKRRKPVTFKVDRKSKVIIGIDSPAAEIKIYEDPPVEIPPATTPPVQGQPVNVPAAVGQPPPAVAPN